MILTNWWYAAATIFAVMATPGPAMLLGLGVATQHGVGRSLYVGGGVLTAFSLFALLSLSGIGALVLTEPRVLMALKWFGIGYLTWLGVKALNRYRLMKVGRQLGDAVAAAERSGSFFRHGFLMSLSNMNAVLFFSAIFPQFIDGNHPIMPQIALLYLTFCACWLTAFLSYSVIGAMIRHRVRKSAAARWLHLASGSIYLTAAGMLSLRR